MEMILIAGGFAGVAIALFLVVRAVRGAGSTQETIRSLTEREERLRYGFEESPAGLAYTAPGGQWLQFNRRFAECLGYTREELLRTSYRDLTHPEDRKVETALVRRLRAEEIRHFTLEKRIQQKDGKHKYIHEMCSVSRRGTPAECYLWVVEDSANRTGDSGGREEPIMSVMQRFEDFAFVRMNPQGMILSWNRGAEKLLGFMRNDVIGKSHKVLYRDVDVWEDKHVDDLKAAAMKGQIAHEDWRVGKDGYIRWMKTYIAADRREGDLQGFFEVFMEPPPDTKVLEEQKRSYEMLKRSSEEKLEEDRRIVTSLRREVERREQTEESLRETLEQLRTTREQSLRELQIMAEATKKEIARRKMVESMLGEAQRELEKARSDFEERLVSIVHEPGAPELVAATPDDTPEGESTIPWTTLGAGDGELMLREAAANQRTGTLYTRWQSRRTEIFFKRGKIFSCSSNDPSRYLAQMLINLGFMSEDDRQRAIEFQQQTNLSLGRVLLILDSVSERDMAEVLRLKAEEEVIEICSRTDGEVAFVDGDVPSALQLVPMRLDVEALLPTPFEEIATTVPAPQTPSESIESIVAPDTEEVAAAAPEASPAMALAQIEEEPGSVPVSKSQTEVLSPDHEAEKAHFEEILREWDEMEKSATAPAVADAEEASVAPRDESDVVPAVVTSDPEIATGELPLPSALEIARPAEMAAPDEETQVPASLLVTDSMTEAGVADAVPGDSMPLIERVTESAAGDLEVAAGADMVTAAESEVDAEAAPEVEAGLEVAEEFQTGIAFQGEPVDAQEPFVANRSGKKPRKYHRSSCKSARKIPAKTRVTFASAIEAEDKGYVACKTCTKG